MEVVLSGMDPGGDLKAYSGFCFPMQIAHRAVLDLVRHGTQLAFMPRLVRMPQVNPCRDSDLCPISQAAPDVLAKAFPEIRFLSPLLDFANGYETSSAMVETAVRELGTRREVAEQAWRSAVRAQTAVDRALRDLGDRALAEAVALGKPAILLAGHSYNAFSAEASQSVGKKLSSMGVTVIPADCLPPVKAGATSWHFANQLLNAAAIAKQHSNLFRRRREQFRLHDRRVHALHAGIRNGRQAVPRSRDRCSRRRRRRPNAPGSVPGDHRAPSRRRGQPCRAVRAVPPRAGRSGHRFEWRARQVDRPAREDLLPELLSLPHAGHDDGRPLAGPACGRGHAAGSLFARPRSRAHVWPRVPSAAPVRWPVAASPRTTFAGRDRRFLYAAGRCALRPRRVHELPGTVRRGRTAARSLPVRYPGRQRRLRFRSCHSCAVLVGGNSRCRYPRGNRAGAPRRGSARQRGATQGCVAAVRRRRRISRSVSPYAAGVRHSGGRAPAHTRPTNLSARRGDRRLLYALQPVLHGRRSRALHPARHHPQAR